MADAAQHMLIRASAGSGKTYALSNRYLKLLADGAEPGTILATTFTRKAAGEIAGRVLVRLAEAARDEAGAAQLGADLGLASLDLDRTREMLGRLTRQVHRIAISTIDAFQYRMAMCWRYELGLPPAPRLTDEQSPEARRLRREAIDAMLGSDDPMVLVEMLRRLHHDESQRRISDAIDDLVVPLYDAFRDTTRDAWHRLPPPPVLSPAHLASAIARLREADALVSAQRSWATAWQKDLERACGYDWPEFLAKGIAGKIAEGEVTYRTKTPLPQALVDAYNPLIAHAKASVVKQVADQTEATWDLLDRFDREFAGVREAEGVLFFSDLPRLLVQRGGMGELEELYYRLDERVSHLLLDEFQDTSPVQWQVLEPFGREIVAGDAEAGERSFFCVGDVKQSIYGWRDGCPEVFDAAIDALHLPQESLRSISKSYRSSQVVLDAVNEVFRGIDQTPPLAELTQHVARWQSDYKKHVAAFDDRPGFVRMIAPPEPEADAEASDIAEAFAEFVADYVQTLEAAHPTRSIGILVRRNATVADLLDRLRARGVRASGEGGARLDDDVAVEAVLAALTLADHPGDSAAAFHVLNSPLGAVLSLERVSGGHVASVAMAVRRSLADEGLAGVLTRWTRELAPVCNRRSVRRLTQLIEAADAYDSRTLARPSEFVRFVRTTRVEEPSADRLRVMTVHRSKGLQFDITVLCELTEIIGQIQRQLIWRYRKRETEPAAAVYRSARKELLPTLEGYDPTIAAAREQEIGRQTLDDLSALYVAMTRPRFGLHMIVPSLQQTKRGWSSRGFTNASPAAILRHQLTDVSQPEPGGVLYEHGDPDWDTDGGASEAAMLSVETPVSVSPRLDGSARAARRLPILNPSGAAATERVDVARLVSPVSAGLAYGTMVHEALAEVAWIDEGKEQALPELVRPMFEHAAIRSLFTEATYEREGEAVELWREQPFALREEGHLVHGTFDRVVVARGADGKPAGAWLIDFKTDRLEGGGAAKLAATYRGQIALYRRALSSMLKLDAEAIKACLALVGEGQVLEM